MSRIVGSFALLALFPLATSAVEGKPNVIVFLSDDKD